MTTHPTLALLNFNEAFTIEVDASRERIRAVLTQQGKLITYISLALRASKLLWSTYAKELLAIIVVIQTWRLYLLGCKFFYQN